MADAPRRRPSLHLTGPRVGGPSFEHIVKLHEQMTGKKLSPDDPEYKDAKSLYERHRKKK